MECKEVRAKIYSMFVFCYTPENISKVKSEVNPHLIKCRPCREYFYEQFEKKKELEKSQA